jgi:hydrogenase/urease accessory protein HupE
MSRRGALLAGVLFAMTRPLAAHEVNPGYLEFREEGAGRYRVLWKHPRPGEVPVHLTPVFPSQCRDASGARPDSTRNAFIIRLTLECAGGIRGKELGIQGLEGGTTDVLVRVYHADGVLETILIRADNPVVTVGRSGGSLAYFQLGVQHILMGVDHLLFVLGLLLIVSNRWMLLKTITSFTVAHSITLGIATLGFASAPVLPLNAAIALSILFLGPEIIRANRGESSLTIRAPWLVAFAFGLLHGFGFASGLTTLGLPRAEIPLALLLFNVGVEAGQLFFVALILLLARAFRTLQVRWPAWAQALPAYTIGGLGAYWTIQRTLMLFAR